ncbi:1-acyl-sn-glycerol-3-phosphate acyltransferase [Hymenobacter busanensis]|uniref:1-acyl-sn-glycerol-3-phosphate acyltransferase n=2 Tax=Hymenobacter busanensis TaxID=2607656 RepID=A0A7L5A2I6_9BACT|nr:1-acyl-sn-glycerol-3-phosphate acyltransferase [Hymenobacter busanensis]QHJ09768.1 1-acyl-sn-glycerol-3-phosphate acyltransferase [Hymenobacter busanensis]
MPFVLTYPLQWLLSRRPAGHRYMHALNRVWALLFIRMWGIPVDIIRKAPMPTGPYVYVSNHSSYIDIPLLFKAIPGFLNIIGKSSLAKVPLWGTIFGNTYITVNRDSVVSRARSIVQARKSLEEGRSVIIFAEGKISDKPGEELMPFKDGPFQLAIAVGVPVVPITMPYNHHFMPDVSGSLRVRYAPLRVVMHAPISTQGLTAADAPALRERVQGIVASALDPAAGGIPEPSTWRTLVAPKRTTAPADAVLPNS